MSWQKVTLTGFKKTLTEIRFSMHACMNDCEMLSFY